MTGPITIPVTIPGMAVLTANQRPHWAERNRRTGVIVASTKVAVRVAFGPKPPRFQEQVHALAMIEWYGRPWVRDDANMGPTVKAVLDGVVRAGVLIDDSRAWVVGPDIRSARVPSPSRGLESTRGFQVVLTLTPTGREDREKGGEAP